MRGAELVVEFVRRALEAGRSRDEITAALGAAGWSPGEVAAGMAAWSEADFRPAVPRPRSFVSAREAFQYAILFAALVTVCWTITSLGFTVIDRLLVKIPEEYYGYDYAASQIRWDIAVLLVAMPIFLLLNRRMNLLLQRELFRRRSALRKWFGYVTLFLAAMALAGDLVSAIYSLLSGELTLSVSLKIALVAATAGAVYWYFHLQMKDAGHEG